MKPVDIIIIAIIVAVLGFSVWNIIRAKKKGVKCIGCPSGGSCSGHCSGCGGACGCDAEGEEK